MDKSRLTGTNITISCPDPNRPSDNPPVGDQFHVCGTVSVALRPDLRVHCRVLYVDENEEAQNVDLNDITPSETSWTCEFDLDEMPKPPELGDVYITARLYSVDGEDETPLTPTRSVVASYQVEAENACSMECPGT